MRTIKILIFVLISIATLSSCENYLDRYPLSGPSSSSFYTNAEELQMGLYGCYKSLNFKVNGEPRPWNIILDVTSDIGWNRSNSDMQHLGNGSHDSETKAVRQYWSGFYDGIGRCNFLLDNVVNLQGIVDESTYKQTIAEARFIRAINYHYLSELFGAVPLVTKTLTLDEAQVPRNSKVEIVDFVLNELQQAAEDLPESYSNDAYHGRATKWTALAFASRVALFNEQWDLAAQLAKRVMDSGQFRLHDDYQELFQYSGQNSPEILLSLQYLQGVITHSTPNFFGSRLAGGVSNEVPTQSMVDSYLCLDGLPIDESPLFNPEEPFKNRDPRLSASIVLPGSVYFNIQFETHPDSLKVWNYNLVPAAKVNNSDATSPYATYTGYLWRKYTDIRDMSDDSHSEMNLILMRYAEVLLIYAEAKIEAGDIDETVYAAINALRTRPSVDMPEVKPGLSQEGLRSVVRIERKCELAVEGLRLFDIRRWKLAESLMQGPLLGRIPTDFLAQAPEIDANGTPDYSNVSNRAEMRLIENKTFKPGRDYLWPIPHIEILTNDQMKQNPGY